MYKTKNYLLLITSFMLCDTAYSQTSNMQLPQQVGVYSANSSNTSQMQLPQQVGTYQRNTGKRVYANPYTVNPSIKQKTVVDYSKYPTMSQQLYENTNGYQTPNRYVLQSPSVQARAQAMAQNQKLSEEFGTEYYLTLGYGMGSFEGEGLTNSQVIPPMNNVSNGLGDPKLLHIGFGVMQDRDTRIDVSYTNISGLKYDSTAYTEEQWCGPTEFSSGGDFMYDCVDESAVSGGSIKSNALMLNVQVPLNDLFGGPILDGMLTPYIGGGIGIAFNSISDYTVSDEYGNAEIPLPDGDGNLGFPTTVPDANGYADDLTGYYQYNGAITHFGAMTNSVAWAIEAGFTVNLDKKTMLDVYYRTANYGSIKSKDYVHYVYDVVDIVDPTDETNTSTDGSVTDYCTQEALDDGFIYNSDTEWCESESYTEEGYISNGSEKGKIETTEIGVKLRLIF